MADTAIASSKKQKEEKKSLYYPTLYYILKVNKANVHCPLFFPSWWFYSCCSVDLEIGHSRPIFQCAATFREAPPPNRSCHK